MVHFFADGLPEHRAEPRRAGPRSASASSPRPLELIAEAEYVNAPVAAVAERRGRRRHRLPLFPSKSELFAEVFSRPRSARSTRCGRRRRTTTALSVADRIAAGTEAFAVAPRRPPPGVALSPSRWTRRSRPSACTSGESYRDVLAEVLEEGVASGELPTRTPRPRPRRWSAPSASRWSALSPPAIGSDPEAVIASFDQLLAFAQIGAEHRRDPGKELGMAHRRSARPESAPHEVESASPAACGLTTCSRRTPVLTESVGSRGRRLGAASISPSASSAGAGRRHASSGSGERAPAELEDPRPLRQAHRRGRVPPRLARPARHGGRARSSTRCPGSSPSPAPTSRAAPPSCGFSAGRGSGSAARSR